MTVLGPTAPARYPIGHSDYAEVRRSGLTYVDKTLWVSDVLDNPAKVLLVPRPRRFGKTLNMTTLRYFVERTAQARADLFGDTAVWSLDGGRVRTHFQRYPVIYLSFKDVKAGNWEDCWSSVRALVQDEAKRAWDAYDLGRHFAHDSQVPLRYLELCEPDAGHTPVVTALAQLSRWLHTATGERVVILIDEYDAPLHAAWQHGYWDQAVTFFRGLLSGGLKDNPHLFKGVLTGILKVAKEGIFSGLNHIQTASILNDRMATHFGFTERELVELLAGAGREADGARLAAWYNGYQFGGATRHTIYNPWSILSYLDDADGGPRSFWKNTSDNALIRTLLLRHAVALGPDVEVLLGGGVVARTLDESVALPHLDRDLNAVFGLLTFGGYLTAVLATPTAHGFDCQLRIPNHEVRAVFADSFLSWVREGSPTADGLAPLARALLRGDAKVFERELGALLKVGMSFFDFGQRPVEAVYQAFVVGLLLHLDATHRVRSNRESGYGRADVLVTPRTPGPGCVLELKVIDADYDETVQSALDAAAAQLVAREYAAEVRDGGATVVHQFAVVFDGKRCWVRVVPAEWLSSPS